MSEKAAVTPSQSDINFMVQIFQHMTEKPVIDWQSFADAAGFKSPSVAQTRWGQIKKKFNNSAIHTPKKTPSKTAGSAAKVKKAAGRVGTEGKKAVKTEDVAGYEGAEDEEEIESPTKVAPVKLEDAFI
ncbi:hypothetical protein LX36DRAFT_719015 [Colletotrichum falcatum]|nr:hypothetical protein LX36DRAFT_719015 [Colletotrichum falcatum]